MDQWCKLCETRECFCFSCRYGRRQAYQITILHQNSWTEITTSGGLDQNVPQSFASQMDRWGRHLLAVVHEIKQLNLTYRRVNTELLIHHTRKSSKVLTAFSKKRKTTFKYYTGDLCQKYQIRWKWWQKRHYFTCIFFFINHSSSFNQELFLFSIHRLNVVLLIFIISMESFSQPVSWTKVVCPRDKEGKRFSNPPADAAYYSHRSKTSSFDGMTDRQVWRPWGH